MLLLGEFTIQRKLKVTGRLITSREKRRNEDEIIIALWLEYLSRTEYGDCAMDRAFERKGRQESDRSRGKLKSLTTTRLSATLSISRMKHAPRNIKYIPIVRAFTSYLQCRSPIALERTSNFAQRSFNDGILVTEEGRDCTMQQIFLEMCYMLCGGYI